MMKVTIIYDNESYEENLEPDWGFSALLEIEGTPRILFDTGTEGEILLSNMEKLEIDPGSIGEVFISHAHFDHVGGLPDFLSKNNEVGLYVPESFSAPEVKGKMVKIRDPKKIHDGVFSTGELDGIEQSLAVETEKGIVIIAGCSHPPMNQILESASRFGQPYGIIGGLHGTNPESLDGLGLICATHCTQRKKEIESRFPDEYTEGGAGRVIEL